MSKQASKTSKPKHIAGPWRASGTCVLTEVDADRMPVTVRRICECGGNPNYVSNQQAEANANLIAAAPDLLEALKDARETVYSAVRAGVDLPSFDPAEHVTIKKIDAAIAKVEAAAQVTPAR